MGRESLHRSQQRAIFGGHFCNKTHDGNAHHRTAARCEPSEFVDFAHGDGAARERFAAIVGVAAVGRDPERVLLARLGPRVGIGRARV